MWTQNKLITKNPSEGSPADQYGLGGNTPYPLEFYK